MTETITDGRSGTAPTVASQGRVVLWQLGFRPFYFLASVFAALSVPLWVAQYAGYLPAPYVNGPLWHGYEMLFGYTAAVITGFLFTAVRTWSGQPTPTGRWLAGFAVLWLAGRILIFLPYPMAAMLINTAFPLAVAIGIAVPLVRAANRRNYFVILLMGVLGVASLLFQLASLNLIDQPALPMLQAGLDVVLLLIAIMAGRVVPMFSNNAIPGLHATRKPLVEKTALGAVIALIFADMAQAPAAVLAAVACVAAAVQLAR